MPHKTPKRGPKFWLKLSAPIVAATLGLICLKFLTPHLINQHQLGPWLHRFGPWAPIVFVVLLAVRPLTLLPGQMLTALGGLFFGTLRGALFAIAGHFLATALVFGAARRFGPRLLKRVAGGQYEALVRAARRHDFSFAVLTTINPLMPTDVTVAAAAASKARFWPTVLGVTLGSLPGTFLTAQFGSALGQGKTIATALSLTGLVVSLVLGALLGRKVLHEIDEDPGEAKPPLTPSPSGARATAEGDAADAEVAPIPSPPAQAGL